MLYVHVISIFVLPMLYMCICTIYVNILYTVLSIPYIYIYIVFPIYTHIVFPIYMHIVFPIYMYMV